jgi:hypothetical protein
MSHQAGIDRIPHHVAHRYAKVDILLDKDGFVPPLKQMADAIVTPVRVLRVAAIDLSHERREVRARRRQNKMKVVAHQAVGVDGDAISFGGLRENLQKPSSIAIIFEDRGLAVPASHHVI